MSRFIKVSTLNYANIEADTTAHLRADEIIDVREATALDRKQRNDVKTLIILRNGNCLAVEDSTQDIVEAIEQASL